MNGMYRSIRAQTEYGFDTMYDQECSFQAGRRVCNRFGSKKE